MESSKPSEIFDVDMGQELNAEKRAVIEEKLKQRQNQKKDRDEGGNIVEKDPNEDFNYIDSKFTATIAAIQKDLPAWKELDKEKYEPYFECLFERYKELRDYISNYSYSVPSYNLQSYQSQLDTLNSAIATEKDTAIPKKKFTFARKQPATQPKKEEVKAQPTVEQSKILSSIVQNDLSIKDLDGQEIRKTESEYFGKENVIIENLKDCTIYLPFKIKSIYAKNLTNCLVYVGCVSSATFVNQAINCEFHMCSQQIRIHNSVNTEFHLIAKSNPIIEHCQQMRFAVYNCAYEGLEEDQKLANLHDIKNFWDQVLDFNWHKQDKSPNWDKMEQKQQKIIG